MNPLDQYAGALKLVTLLQEALANPEKIKTAAEAIAAGYTLTDAEVKKRDEYNLLVHEVNQSRTDNAQELDKVNAAWGELRIAQSELITGQKALVKEQGELVDSQSDLKTREDAVGDRENKVTGRENAVIAREAAADKRDATLNERETAVATGEDNLNQAASLISKK